MSCLPWCCVYGVNVHRCTGLAGIIDLGDKDGNHIAMPHDTMSAKVSAFKHSLKDAGLIVMMRPNCIYLCPPLIIEESQINDAFKILDECLSVLD